jgi:hypothetical protein
MSKIFSWLMSPLNRWELAEYIGAAVVFLGVLGEYLAEFHVFQHKEDEKRRRKVTRWSTLALLGGLALELLGLVRTSQLYRVEIAEANKAAALANERAADLENKMHSRWRNVILGNGKEMADKLKGKPVSRFEIVYSPEDEEAYTYGALLKGILVGAGWTFVDLRPLRESDVLEGKDNIPGAPLAVRAGAWYGLSLNSKTGIPSPPWDYVNESASAALMEAFGGGQGITDPRLPDNIVRIVIGQKQ